MITPSTNAGNDKIISTFLRETLAIILWLLIFVKIFVIDIDILFLEKFAPSYRWILHYRFFGLLAIVSLVFIVLGIKGSRNFLGYIAAYPLVVLFYKIPKLIFRNWALTIAFIPAIYELLRSFRFTFILITLASISCVTIALSFNPTFLIIAMGLLGLFLIVHLYKSLRRAYRTSAFAGLAEMVKK